MSLVGGMQSLEKALTHPGLWFSSLDVMLGCAGVHTFLSSWMPGTWGSCQSGMGQQQACLTCLSWCCSICGGILGVCSAFQPTIPCCIIHRCVWKHLLPLWLRTPDQIVHLYLQIWCFPTPQSERCDLRCGFFCLVGCQFLSSGSFAAAT